MLHDRDVDRVSRGESGRPEHDRLRALGVLPADGEDVVDHAEHGVEGGLEGVPAIDGGVAMQDLLEDLGIRHESVALGDRLLQQPLRIGLDEHFDPRAHRLFLVQGRIRPDARRLMYSSASEAHGHRRELRWNQELMLDVSRPSFVRLEIRGRDDEPLLFSNPIVFDRKKRISP